MSNGRIFIVGAGINGLCCAWHLVQLGFEVEIFDRGGIPNTLSSSFDEHRVTRHAYGTMHDYAGRMPEAFRIWERIYADIGERPFIEMPVIAFEREKSGWIEASIEDMSRMGISWRELDTSRFAEHNPLLRGEGVIRAVELGGAGVLLASRIVIGLVNFLGSKGVRFHAHCEIKDIDTATATITLGPQRLKADHLVIAAGTWVNRILPATAGRLVPSRQTVVFLAPPASLAEAWRKAPVYFDLDAETGTYVLPPVQGTRLKIGDHRFTRVGDPDADRAATEAEVSRLLAACRMGYRDFEAYTVLERKACYYTVTETEDFVIEPVGTAASLISACSGHGFKLAPHSAKLLVDLVIASRSVV